MRERNKRSDQWSAVLLVTQQSNVQPLQRHVATSYARSTATTDPTDTPKRNGTGRHVSVDDGEMTGDGVRTVRRRREVSHSRSPKESKKDENVRQR
jgi:hypothetical protein